MKIHLEPEAGVNSLAKVGCVEISPVIRTNGKMVVLDEKNKPVASKLLWSPPNQPSLICFDSSSHSKSYTICYGPLEPDAPAGWKPQAGVLLTTRPCAENQKVNRAELKNEDKVAELIKKAGPIQGMEFVWDMRRGVNPFGPSDRYLASFTGWFKVDKAGEYGFATDSTDPSFIEIDGEQVTAWLGHHSKRSGRNGDHNGTVLLQPGLHSLHYLNLQISGKRGCEVAWKPPGASQYRLMYNGDFAPIVGFRVAKVESPSRQEVLYFNWDTRQTCTLSIAKILGVRFSLVNSQPNHQYRWRFDDGSTETGSTVDHVFIQEGLHKVTVEAFDQGKLISTNSTQIRITDNWTQHDKQKQQEISFAQMKQSLLRQDLSKMPASELTLLAQIAVNQKDSELLLRSVKAMIQRSKEFETPAAGEKFYRLGLALTHKGDLGDDLAKSSLQLAADPARASSGIADKARLRLSDLLINTYGQSEGAEELLKKISDTGLNSDESRLKKCLEADLLLTQGKIEEARKHYLALASTDTSANADFIRDNMIEHINLLMEQNQLDESSEALERLRLDYPLERISAGTGLVEADLAIRQQDFNRAFTTCQRLLPVSSYDRHLPDLLYNTIKSGLALNRQDEARQALNRLQKDFPNSEAAAKASSQWSSH